MAHGHYEPKPDRSIGPRPSWLIGDDEIAATGADYVALGHWNRAVRVGNGSVPAYYSGSPEYAGTVNVVRLGERRRHRYPCAARHRARSRRTDANANGPGWRTGAVLCCVLRQSP